MKLSLYLFAASAGITYGAAFAPASPKPGTGYHQMIAKGQVNTAALRNREGAPRIARRAGPSSPIVTQVLVGKYLVRDCLLVIRIPLC